MIQALQTFNSNNLKTRDINHNSGNKIFNKTNTSKQINFGLEILPSFSDNCIDIVTEIIERLSDRLENIGKFFKKPKNLKK